MSDGTTGFQVAPTEEAMKLSKALQFAADAITNHSSMRQELDSLRSEIARVRSDLDASHTHSQELDQTIHELRQQRDEARDQAHTLERDLGWRSHDLDNAQRTISEQQTQIGSLTDVLTSAKKDRDEYGMKMMELEEQVTSWKARAEQARARLADMASLFKVDEPEPPEAEPEPTPNPTVLDSPVESGGAVSSVSVENTENASPPSMTDTSTVTVEPEPSPVRHYLNSWQPDALWDDIERRYYLTDDDKSQDIPF